MWKVDHVKGRREISKGKSEQKTIVQFLCAWAGYGESYDSWVAEEGSLALLCAVRATLFASSTTLFERRNRGCLRGRGGGRWGVRVPGQTRSEGSPSLLLSCPTHGPPVAPLTVQLVFRRVVCASPLVVGGDPGG